MLLGLLAAAMLATLLQLHALRAKRRPTFEFTGDDVIHLRCWTVVETLVAVPDRAPALLALPAPVRWPEPLRLVGEIRMTPPRRPARTPAKPRAIVHAGVDRFRRFRSAIVIPGDLMLDLLPTEAAWPAHSRPPPRMSGPVPSGTMALH